MSNFFKKREVIFMMILLLLVAIILLVWSFLFNTKGNSAIIYYGETIIYEVDLVENQPEEEFKIEGYEDVVFKLYEDGSIAFIEADCPDHVCIDTGKISQVGQVAICLPNQIMVVINGPEKTDLVLS
ncbi:MAG: NusG domain II-containing protein [Erysipelotrichaceae bacterium]